MWAADIFLHRVILPLFAARCGIAFYCASEDYLHIAEARRLGHDARRVKAAWEEEISTAPPVWP